MVSSLRGKLLLLSLVLVVVPGAMFGAIAISNGRRSLTEAVGRQLAEEARNASDSLAGAVAGRFEDVRTFARQDLMREIRIGDLDKRISAFLASLKHGEAAILELRVTDREGRVVAASEPARIGEVDDRFAANKPRRAAESLRGPLIPRHGSTPALELVVPVPDPDRSDEPVGHLVALYDWSRATRAAGRIRQNLLRTGVEVDVLIVDAAGVVIGGATGERTQTPLGVNLRTAGWQTASGLHPAASGFTVEPKAGALVGFMRLQDGGPPWTVLVVEPLSTALAPVRDMTVGLALTLGAVLVAALVAAALLANRVARPLRELTRATQDIARGTRPGPLVAARSSDEVGELAAAFNQMSTDLRRAESDVLEAAKFAFVGELAAGVAHEVRTTLGVLRSSAQILEPSLGRRDAEAAELIQIMLQEINRLDGVVTQLLTLGRPRDLAVEPTSLAVVFRAADFVEAQARGKGVVIRRIPCGDAPVALCDEEQIYEVALNLLVNAVQVVPQGGEIRVALLLERDGMVGFEIQDDGPGIPEEIRQSIFLPFFTRREGGTGLGLTFVRRVIQEHGGRLSVESEVGVGSVFRVELPAVEIEA